MGYIGFRVSQNWGYHFGGSHNKDYSILGSILGSPNFGKLPHEQDPRLLSFAGELCLHALNSLLSSPIQPIPDAFACLRYPSLVTSPYNFKKDMQCGFSWAAGRCGEPRHSWCSGHEVAESAQTQPIKFSDDVRPGDVFNRSPASPPSGCSSPSMESEDHGPLYAEPSA